MATIVNARDTLLQAAAIRLIAVTLPSNLAVDFANVSGGTKPANNADVTVTAVNGGIIVTGGGFTLSGGGSIKGGQSGFDSGTGFFLGWSASLGAYGFSIGNSAGDKMTWNGSALGIVGQITGGTMKIGTGGTPGGKALEIVSTGVIFVDNIFGGFLNGSTRDVSGPAVKGTTNHNIEGVWGQTASVNTNTSAHAVRGLNSNTGAAGLIGGQNGYDFYADGSGTNYGPFTGTHDAVIAKGRPVEIGDIVVDVQCVARRDISNTLFEVEISNKPSQRGARGVVCALPQSLDRLIPAALAGEIVITVDTTGRPHGKPDVEIVTRLYDPKLETLRPNYMHLAMNGLGEGQINVCGEGGDIRVGDLIVTSSIAGKGMAQADDVVRSYTVAQAREAAAFSGPRDIKQLACIYLCG